MVGSDYDEGWRVLTRHVIVNYSNDEDSIKYVDTLIWPSAISFPLVVALFFVCLCVCTSIMGTYVSSKKVKGWTLLLRYSDLVIFGWRNNY